MNLTTSQGWLQTARAGARISVTGLHWLALYSGKTLLFCADSLALLRKKFGSRPSRRS